MAGDRFPGRVQLAMVPVLNNQQMAKIINLGSVEDIRCHLQHYGTKNSIETLEEEIEMERKDRNRVTVINLLTAQIARNKKLS